jgi:hypothetical protein
MDEILMGLLSPEQQAAAQQRAQQAGLLNLGFGLLQASRGAPGQGRPGLGQIVGQAGPGALQAYQGSFDKTLRDLLIGQQFEDAKKKRERQTQIEALAPRLLTEVRGPETVTQDVYDARDALAQGGQITRPGEVVGYQVNRALLPGVAALGP